MTTCPPHAMPAELRPCGLGTVASGTTVPEELAAQHLAIDRLEIESLEVELVLEAVYRRYGYDFRDYAKATLRRRLSLLASEQGADCISELIPNLLREKSSFDKLVSTLSVTVTELFRDPQFYSALRENVLPVLTTYSFFKIWHAGCATGEEVYSLAILLTEAGLYDRAQLYGTDINPGSLEKAKQAIFPLDTMKQGQENYVRSGGRSAFTDHYHARYNAAKLRDGLAKNITWSRHNLVSDTAFGEMNIVICRNVLIYFNRELKDRVLTLFHDSLCHRGYLCLGSKETLDFSVLRDKFEIVSREHRIYRKL